MAVPSVSGAESVNAQGHAIIRTAVATLALAATFGHHAIAPAAASAIAPIVNQAPNRAATSVSHLDYVFEKIGLFQRLAKWLCDTARSTRSLRMSVVARPPARTTSPSATGTGACSPVTNA